MSSIQPSVIRPVSLAIDRVTRLLFTPFDLERWLSIGFCAWLAQLGESGLGGGFNFRSPQTGRHPLPGFEQIKRFIFENLTWLIPLVIVVISVILAVGILLTWLSSRGQMLFLRAALTGKGEVAVPWREFARDGNSLFFFRLLLELAGMAVLLLLTVPLGLYFYRAVEWKDGWLAAGVLIPGLAAVAVLLGMGILFGVISVFTTDFIVPIMYLRRGGCRAAWREFLKLLSANVGEFVLYLLFRFVLSIGIGLLVLTVVVATCCVAGCLLAIPFLGTVACLPLLAFSRYYSVLYLAQFGSDYEPLAQQGA